MSSSHEEGGERLFSVSTERFVDDGAGNVRAVRVHEVRSADGRFEPVAGTERELPADLVLLAIGFVGPEKGPLLQGLGVEYDARGNVARDRQWRTSVPGVYVAGDMARGQSLIVWAIAEGRSVAAVVDQELRGESALLGS
jgi:glutamate synthase (NADPH/NADH) small chain